MFCTFSLVIHLANSMQLDAEETDMRRCYLTNNTSDEINELEETFQCKIRGIKTRRNGSPRKHMEKEHSQVQQFDGRKLDPCPL